MSSRSESLFEAFVEKLRTSDDATIFAHSKDSQGSGVVLYECRCGALKCAGLTLAQLDANGNAATFALTPEDCTVLGEAMMKLGAS